jgi:hypothetical protein
MEIPGVLLRLPGQHHNNTFTDVKIVVSKVSSRLIICNHPTVSHSLPHNLTVTIVVNKRAWGSPGTDVDSEKDKEKH